MVKPSLLSLAAAGAAAVAIAAPTPDAHAAVTCAKWAATSGSDAGPGTQAAPYRGLKTLIANLKPGETGCLPAGQTYFATEGYGDVRASGGIAGAPVTVTSGPGGRATVKGQIALNPGADDVT